MRGSGNVSFAMPTTISKEQFIAYENVRLGGKTNMFDTNAVQALALQDEDTFLEREDIIDIIKNYGDYKARYLPND